VSRGSDEESVVVPILPDTPLGSVVRATSCRSSPASSHKRIETRPVRLSCSIPGFKYSGQVSISATAGDAEEVATPATPVTPVTPSTSKTPNTNTTPKSSKSHLESWYEPSESIVIFDWDDTLFPTTYVWNDPRLRWDKVAPCLGLDGDESLPAQPDRPEGPSMKEALDQHTNTVSAILRLATSVGRVAIVTLAQAGWVDTSIRNFMPGLGLVLKELNIEVIYCRSSVPARILRLAREEGQDMGKVLKGRAMARLLKRYYSEPMRSGHGRSWKNVISIGDSPGERLALQDLIFHKRQPDCRGIEKKCRCKVLKMLSEPSLERLTAQLQVLMGWLVQMVHHDNDLDVDFEALLEEAGGDSPLSPPLSPHSPRRRRRAGQLQQPPSLVEEVSIAASIGGSEAIG